MQEFYWNQRTRKWWFFSFFFLCNTMNFILILIIDHHHQDHYSCLYKFFFFWFNECMNCGRKRIASSSMFELEFRFSDTFYFFRFNFPIFFFFFSALSISCCKTIIYSLFPFFFCNWVIILFYSCCRYIIIFSLCNYNESMPWFHHDDLDGDDNPIVNVS